MLALATLPLLVMSCTDQSVSAPTLTNDLSASRSVASPQVFVVEPMLMDVPTYDGTGQAVHPDVVLFDRPWNGARYWLTMTPYAASNQTVENPSILRSNDGVTVSVPGGLTNPIVPAPRNGNNYNSDPELLYETQTQRLVLFDRYVDKRSNSLQVLTSTDGVTWKKAGTPLRVRAHRAVSPTIAQRDNAPARMWHVDAGRAGCNAKSTRVETRTAVDKTGRIVDTKWSRSEVTDLAIPGYTIWHIKARWVPEKSEYWMLISAYPNDGNGCQTDDLFFARSGDGIHWTSYTTPVLRHQDREWTAAAVYRTSFLYDANSDQLSLWISARAGDGAWRMGYARARYASLLTALENNREVAPAPSTVYSVKAKLSGDEP